MPTRYMDSADASCILNIPLNAIAVLPPECEKPCQGTFVLSSISLSSIRPIDSSKACFKYMGPFICSTNCSNSALIAPFIPAPPALPAAGAVCSPSVSPIACATSGFSDVGRRFSAWRAGIAMPRPACLPAMLCRGQARVKMKAKTTIIAIILI